MKRYQAFGLEIASDFEISEFIPSDGPRPLPDVEILSGKVPDHLTGEVPRRLQAYGNRFLFHGKFRPTNDMLFPINHRSCW